MITTHLKHPSKPSTPTQNRSAKRNLFSYDPPLRRITVSKVFYEAVQDSFPGLSKHPGYPPLFFYLLFGSWHDNESHELLLCSDLLSRIEGRDPKNSQAEDFLIKFEHEALPSDCIMTW